MTGNFQITMKKNTLQYFRLLPFVVFSLAFHYFHFFKFSNSKNSREKKVIHVTVEDENDNAPRCGQTDFLLRTLPAEIHLNCWDADKVDF